MDILTALKEHNPQRGQRRCKLQSNLDAIEDGTPGKAELVAALEDQQGYPSNRLEITFAAIGLPVGSELISLHRRRMCVCYR